MENYDPTREYALDVLFERGDISEAWEAVSLFEKTIAKFAGSKYAVAVDNCTDALFLCLKYLNAKDIPVTIPDKTYASVPMAIDSAGYTFQLEDIEWSGLYKLGDLPIYDSALRFTEGMYIQDSFQCLSFHRRKVLKLTKGGMILTNDKNAVEWFKMARAKGRSPHKKVFYDDENISIFGWNMYMHPNDAAKGLLIFEGLDRLNDDIGGSHSYPPISRHDFYKKYKVTL